MKKAQRRATMNRWRIGTAGAAIAVASLLGVFIAKTDASGSTPTPAQPTGSSGSSGSGPAFSPQQSPDSGFGPATPDNGFDFGSGSSGGPQTFSRGS